MLVHEPARVVLDYGLEEGQEGLWVRELERDNGTGDMRVGETLAATSEHGA